jgi:hypothetical protein
MYITNSLKRKASLPGKVIKSNLVEDLSNKGYKVASSTERYVYFEVNQKGPFVSRNKVFFMIDKGNFLIDDSSQMIILTYSMYILPDLIAIPLSIIGGFVIDDFIFIFSLLITIQFLIRMLMVRSAAKDLLNPARLSIHA